MARPFLLGALGLAAACALGACQPKIEQPSPEEVRAARAAAIAFDIRLKRDILDRLDRDEDPVAVYLAYADNVPGWGKEISDSNKFEFSRTSLAPRNPANAPDDWERRKMEEFEYLADTGLDPATFEVAEIVQEGDAKVFRWMRPTSMGEQCMPCHGESLDPRIRLLLLQEYPDDQASGYFDGQLGGAFSVRKVLSVKGKPPPPYQPTPLPPRLPADERQPGDAPLVAPKEAPAPAPEPEPEESPPEPDQPF